MTPVPGTVTAEGTPINKANLLTDATAAAIKALSGTTPDTPNAAFAALSTITGKRTKIQTGHYSGTGTSGKSNPNSLTFEFTPKVVFIMSAVASNGYSGIGWIYGAEEVPSFSCGNNSYGVVTCYATWEENVLTWYMPMSGSAAPNSQLNRAGTVYNYIVLG